MIKIELTDYEANIVKELVELIEDLRGIGISNKFSREDIRTGQEISDKIYNAILEKDLKK